MSAGLSLGPPGDLERFPAVRVPKRLVRVCQSVHGTWWFSSDGSGRFDLRMPHGTCYLATDDWSAIREASRLGPVSTEWVRERELREVSAPTGCTRLAATTWKAAGRHGVTTELITVLPYDVPRQWAAAFHSHGFHGIRHQLRHDPRPRASGISVFGPDGANPVPDGTATRLDVDTVRAAGVRVEDRPHSTVLTIVP